MTLAFAGAPRSAGLHLQLASLRAFRDTNVARTVARTHVLYT
jgi:hypothetical protein